MTKKILMLIISIALLWGCSDEAAQVKKQSFMKSFERFVDKVEEDSPSYTDKDWEKANARYEKFVEEDYPEYEAKLTSDEKRKVSKLKGRYQSLRAKSTVSDVIDVVQQVSGFVEGVQEAWNGGKE